jgi:hypothetical protein
MAAVKNKPAWSLALQFELQNSLRTWVNGTPVFPETVDAVVQDRASGKYHIVFDHGHAKSFTPAGAAAHFTCRAEMKGGGLHVWIDGKEINAVDARFDIAYR